MSIYQSTDRNSFLRNANIEREQKMAEELLRRKNNSDGKVTDNMLKISIILNFSLIFLNIFLITVSTKVLSSKPVEETKKQDKSYLGISIISLTTDMIKTKEHINYNLFCISDENCGKENCDIKNSDIDYKELSIKYNITCKDFFRLKILGIYYIIITAIGNLFTLSNNVTLILLLCGKVKLTTAECINVISRWDFIFYFAGVIGYILGSNVIFNNNICFARENIILLIIVTLSSINFYCIKTNLSQKIRIRARSRYLENNLLNNS